MTVLSVLLVATVGRAQEMPFFSQPTAPDYLATMAFRGTTAGRGNVERSVSHHSGWIRVSDVLQNETTMYFSNVTGSVLGRATRVDGGNFTSFGISAVSPRQLSQARKTGETGSENGQPCIWWEIDRDSTDLPAGMKRFSCQSDDGIEMGARLLDRDSATISESRLQSLRRDAGSPADVLPPAKLFDAKFWLAPLRSYETGAAGAVDYEVDLASVDARARLLRHYPWYLWERRGDDGSRELTIWNELEDQGLSMFVSREKRRLKAARSAIDAKRPRTLFTLVTGRNALGNTDRHLGEACSWFDMTPNLDDIHETQCLTADGIPLKKTITSGWARHEEYTATRLVRRSVSIGELIPSDEETSPSKWGFPALE